MDLREIVEKSGDADLVGDVAPGGARLLSVGLAEGLADRRRDDGVLAAGHVGERVTHPVHAAPLPCRLEDAPDGGLEAGVRVGDDELHAGEPARLEPPQELRPEGLRLRGSGAEAVRHCAGTNGASMAHSCAARRC